MAGYHQILLLFLFFTVAHSSPNNATNSSTSNLTKRDADLDAAEANGKLEIIKQIKKVNDDGSYTIGYEADDGSFKIESRDVLGNIKGTYGYIDDNGDIKRVSYSSSNATEGITSTSEPISVVQRIPSKVNVSRTSPSPTTRRPYTSTTSSPISSSSSTSGAVQSIPRRRISLSTTTTSAPTTTTEKYSKFIKEALSASKLNSVTSTPTSATVLYENSTPARLLAQSKPLVRGLSTTQSTHKVTTSEGQLLRPEVLLKPTDMPLYRRLPIKTTLLDEDTKPVTEEPEAERSNVLRRQLPPLNRDDKFDARQHVLNVQQGSGDDTVDVYSASVTTGSPRPLFTTLRPRIVTTTLNPLLHRPTPTIRYPTYQRAPITRSSITQTPAPTTEYTQETSTESSVTVSPVPVVQIPANSATGLNSGSESEEPIRQQYVELRHPYHRGAILVPVNHLARRPSPENDQIQYQQVQVQPQQIHQVQPLQGDQSGQEPVYQYRRIPKFRPIPVHVDENGFIREYSTPNPYAVQRPVTLSPVHDVRQPYISQNDIINEVDSIKPPVSTRDFQKLLEQLIQRQSRLEKISALTSNPHMYRPRQYQDYQHNQQYQQPQHHIQHNQVQFVPRTQTQTAQPQQQHPVIVRPAPQPLDEHPYNQYAPVTFTPSPVPPGQQPNYHPTKRMVRPAAVHHNQHLQQEQSEDEYLPAPVREMLLLRMLQLAINPSLPLDVMDNIESATTITPLPQNKILRSAVRNVEILGEADEDKRPSRTKRYKQVEFEYYD